MLTQSVLRLRFILSVKFCEEPDSKGQCVGIGKQEADMKADAAERKRMDDQGNWIVYWR